MNGSAEKAGETKETERVPLRRQINTMQKPPKKYQIHVEDVQSWHKELDFRGLIGMWGANVG